MFHHLDSNLPRQPAYQSRRGALYTVLFLAGMILAGCAGPGLNLRGVSPDLNAQDYVTGMDFLNQGAFASADSVFRQILARDSLAANALAGSGVAQGHLGGVVIGKLAVDKAVLLKPDDPAIRTLHGRFWLVYPDRAGWVRNALEDFNQALVMDPEWSMARYFQGEAHYRLYEYEQAEQAFSALQDDESEWGGLARVRLSDVKRILMAEPRTDQGRRAGFMQLMTRGGWANLLLEELRADELVLPAVILTDTLGIYPPGGMVTAVETPQDVMGHWAEASIAAAITLGLMVTDLSDNFNPDLPLTRWEVATNFERFLVRVTGDPTLETRYVDDASSRFTDVDFTNMHYNAFALSVDYGILLPDSNTRRIRPMAPVSGVEALEITHAMRRAAERIRLPQ
ncbi:S-layer homology domain-containing protein [Candidatus Neomarinimicrobiota bacterium]